MGDTKKTAAIISLYGNANFGNKLQNYAVQEMLREFAFETTNIINLPCLNNERIDYKTLSKTCIKGVIQYLQYGDKLKDCIDPKDPAERKKNFLSFNNKIVNSNHFFSYFRIKEFENYDFYFVGSDQIWNPSYGGLSDLDLLTFTSKKKIAISASFGVDKIPENYYEKLKQGLLQFDAISVREDAAKRIIETVTGRHDVEVLIDPTMMLMPEEWDKIAKKPKNLTYTKYVVSYFLGTQTSEYVHFIESVAKSIGGYIVDLSLTKSDFYACGPSEFVYLIKHAEWVCTDSFHASVFSILYHKPFIVFDRYGKHDGMGSRIGTLLKTFSLEEAHYSGVNYKACPKRDYTQADRVLEEERQKAYEFIQNAVKSYS